MLIPTAFRIGLCLLPGFLAVDVFIPPDIDLDTYDFGTHVRSETNEVGLQFLEESMARPGVAKVNSSLPLNSTVQYKVLINGTGEFHPFVYPLANTSVELLFSATTPTLTPHAHDLDESPVTYTTGGPNEYSDNLLLSGLQEALALMVVGDKWELYIPAGLGYGDTSTSKINSGDVLIYRLQLLNITGQKRHKDDVPQDPCDWETLEGCDEKDTKFIEKQKGNTPDGRLATLNRLRATWKDTTWEDDGTSWKKLRHIVRRFSILKPMVTLDIEKAEQIAINRQENRKILGEKFAEKMQAMTATQQRNELNKFKKMSLPKAATSLSNEDEVSKEEEEKADWLKWRIDWLEQALSPAEAGKDEL